MRDPQAERNAMRSMAAFRLETETSNLYLEFIKQAGFPDRLRSRLFDDKRLYESENVESVFRHAYPGFPFLLGTVPPKRTKQMTSMKKLFDKKNDMRTAFDECARRNSKLVGDVAMALLMKVPYDKQIWIIHNYPWSTPTGDTVLFVYDKYYLTLQPSGSFMTGTLGSFVTGYISNAMAGSY